MSVKKQKFTAALLSTVLLAAVLGVTSCNNSATQAPEKAGEKSAAGQESPAGDKAADSGDIKIDGSSTVFPITEAVSEDFQKTKGGKIKVSVGVSGTGGGFKKFCRGETDLANASRPILQKEIDACKEKGIEYLELPIAYDALTVVVNNANTWAKTLTVAELKKMWGPEAQGKVKNWKEIRADFPDAPMKLFGAGSSSGTFDYFTEAINGKAKVGRGDYTASEDDNTLVKGVGADKGALGYFGYSYYEANKTKLKAVGIDGGKGAVLPSVETVKNGTYNPLSRPLFVYVSSKALDKPDVKEFVDFYMTNAAKFSASTKYIPLPADAYTKIAEKAKAKKLGTVFGGKEAVGLKIEEILNKETSK
jgi:phosphate transport system substrate-binding protein